MVRSAEIAFRAKGVSGAGSKFKYLRTFLQHTAADFYDQLQFVDFPSWEEFRAKFTERFTLRGGVYVTRRQLNDLRMQGEDIDGYNAEFRRIRRMLPELDEATAKFNYETGVSPQLKTELFQKNLPTVEEAMEFCRVWQIAHSAHRHQAPKYVPIPFSSGPTPYVCT